MAGKRTYNVNLDPAVFEVNFPANIDIRDSVKYKKIMQTYKLGKQTCMYLDNKFYNRTKWCNSDMLEHFCSIVWLSSEINRVKVDWYWVSLTYISNKILMYSYVILDTPGQIEAFSQSASGQIITDTLACTFPTINLYIADTVRCENPNTFTSNMLYSLSILYKSKLPLLLCFNKNDVLDHNFAIEWMRDFDLLD